MSLKAAPRWHAHAHAHARPLRLVSAFAASLVGVFAACGEPKPEVIARFQGQPVAEAGPLAAGGTDAGKSPISPERGRVHVANGKLLTDIDTPLRGVLMPVDTGFTLSALGNDLSSLNTLAETTGLNTLHVYLENSSLDTGSMEGEGDSIVSLAAQAGLYVIIGMGTGQNVGAFDQAKLTAFWAHYAPRYANDTHVLFEIQNNPDPEASCSKDLAAKTTSMELTVYRQIRALAPDTHILLFSTTSIVQPNVFSDAVAALGGAVDWSNAAFDMDINSTTPTDDCLQLAALSQLTAAAKSQNIALLIGQLPHDGWGPYIQRFEQDGIGWVLFRWFGLEPDLSTFDGALTSAGVSWCPERGTFPEDSSTCH